MGCLLLHIFNSSETSSSFFKNGSRNVKTVLRQQRVSMIHFRHGAILTVSLLLATTYQGTGDFQQRHIPNLSTGNFSFRGVEWGVYTFDILMG
jgi:hypothetical protein